MTHVGTDPEDVETLYPMGRTVVFACANQDYLLDVIQSTNSIALLRELIEHVAGDEEPNAGVIGAANGRIAQVRDSQEVAA